MSTPVLSVCASHTTLMNTRWDEVDHLERAHEFRDALAEGRRRLEAAEPDLVVIIGSNHFRGFWLDLMPAFTIGVGEVIGAGEHGTPAGPLVVDPPAARHLCQHLLAADFDIAFSADLDVDHGITHAVQYLVPDETPIVPVVINTFAPPLPSLPRTSALGRALHQAIGELPGDRRVAVIGTGGLSHALPFPDWRSPDSDDDEFLVDSWRHGRGDWSRYEQRRRSIIVSAPPRIAEGFDQEFLAALAAGDHERFATSTGDADLVARAGNGGNEVRAWLAACAAIDSAGGDVICYSPMPEWLTGMAVAHFVPHQTFRNNHSPTQELPSR